MTGGKFAPLTIMTEEDAESDSVFITFNTAVTGTASEILGKQRQKTTTTNTVSLQKFLSNATKGEN